MNCEDFNKWLIDKDLSSERTATSAADHMERCERCANLFRLDLALEDAIRNKLAPVQPSEGILAALQVHVRSRDNRTAVLGLWRKVIASCAAAAAVAFLVIYTLPKQPASVVELGVLAVESHLSGDRHMTIRGPHAVASPSWMEQTMGVAASPPGLQAPRFTFLGARPCKLGPVKAAYLFYEREGQITSVFVVKPQDLGFSPAGLLPYQAKIRGCDVKVWESGNALYVMVI